VTDSRVHHHILTHILDTGHAPDVDQLAAALSLPVPEVEQSLRSLEAGHGLVLHPGSLKVWVIHPFALWPTHFWVTSQRGSWWGNCAWCSLGIAALLKEDVTIATTLGAENEPVEVHVRDGEVVESDLLVHFSVPVARAWENVLYYCGTVLAFRSAPQVDAWCARHRIDKGAVLPIRQVWALARAWYGNHLAPDWRKWTAAEAREILRSVGLTDGFWDVPQSEERF
jgi:Alkylmercury lyase